MSLVIHVMCALAKILLMPCKKEISLSVGEEQTARQRREGCVCSFFVSQVLSHLSHLSHILSYIPRCKKCNWDLCKKCYVSLEYVLCPFVCALCWCCGCCGCCAYVPFIDVLHIGRIKHIQVVPNLLRLLRQQVS